MLLRILIVLPVLLVAANTVVWLLIGRPQRSQQLRALDKELLTAAAAGDAASVDNLLSEGADANATENGNTSLILCSGWEQYDVIEGGKEERHASTVRSLIAHGANPNYRNGHGMTALMYAGGWAHWPTFKALLDSGADTNIRDDKRRTGLTWAARNGPAYCAPLVDKGALVGVTEALLMGYMKKARHLIESGGDLSVVDGLDDTPLMIAAEWGDLACVKALLARKAPVNARDARGYTALMLAAAGRPGLGQIGRYWNAHGVTKGRGEIVRALVAAGADLEAASSFSGDRDTALSLAIGGKNKEARQALIAAGAKLNH